MLNTFGLLNGTIRELRMEFDILFEQYKSSVYAFVRSMAHNNADADDLFQDVFIKIHHALPAYREQGKLKSWILRIAANTVRDKYRKKNSEVRNVSLEEYACPKADPANQAECEEMREIMDRAIRRLSVKLREVYLLRMDAGLSFREVAKILQVPRGTAIGRMHLALKELRSTYERFAGK